MSKTAVKETTELQKKLEKLLELGKRKGYITYDDIDRTFPPGDLDAFDGNFLDQVYETLEKDKIEIRIPPTMDIEEEVKAYLAESLRYSIVLNQDLIKMYLRDIGKIRLLTPSEEEISSNGSAR